MSKKLPKLADVRDDLYRKALDAHDGNTAQAAKAIGIDYTTLYRWLAKNSYCKPQGRRA